MSDKAVPGNRSELPGAVAPAPPVGPQKPIVAVVKELKNIATGASRLHAVGFTEGAREVLAGGIFPITVKVKSSATGKSFDRIVEISAYGKWLAQEGTRSGDLVRNSATQFSPDGNSFVGIPDWKGNLKPGRNDFQIPAAFGLGHAANGQPIGEPVWVETSLSPRTVFSSTNRSLAILSKKWRAPVLWVTVLNTATGKVLGNLTLHTWGLPPAALSSDGQRLITAIQHNESLDHPNDCEVVVLDVKTGKTLLAVGGSGLKPQVVARSDQAPPPVVPKVDVHSYPVTSITVSPNGSVFASSDGDRVRFWDAATGRLVRSFAYRAQRNQGQPWLRGGTNLAYSPAGRLLAAQDGRGMIFFDASTGEEAGIATGHTAAVSAFAFSADGKRLVTGDEGGIVKVWSVTYE